MNLMNLTPKQFGDACEHLILAELGMHGLPVNKAAENFPEIDLIVSTREPGALGTRLIGIQVKGLRDNGKRDSARIWRFKPEGWDWLALVRVNAAEGSREVYVLPKSLVLDPDAAVGRNGEVYYSTLTEYPELHVYRDNFNLNEHPAAITAITARREEYFRRYGEGARLCRRKAA